ncbi:MAG: hypothetical protein Q8L47_00955 [bacterium]|nr:hypothetical protein [bacterium]
MRNNKGFASIVVIGIIVLVVAIGGSFAIYYFNNLNNRNVEQELQTLSTYTDPKFAFEFQYPTTYSPYPNHTVDNEYLYSKSFIDQEGGSDFAIRILYIANGVTREGMDAMIKEDQKRILSRFDNDNATKITIAGTSADRIDYGNLVDDAVKVTGTSNIGGVDIQWIKDDLIYSLNLRSAAKIPKVGLNAIDVIVRTFKYNTQQNNL